MSDEQQFCLSGVTVVRYYMLFSLKLGGMVNHYN